MLDAAQRRVACALHDPDRGHYATVDLDRPFRLVVAADEQRPARLGLGRRLRAVGNVAAPHRLAGRLFRHRSALGRGAVRACGAGRDGGSSMLEVTFGRLLERGDVARRRRRP